MYHIFISDIHYGAFREETNAEIERDLLSLVDYCEKENAVLHILGDLFDYWMEYPGTLPGLGQGILQRFSRYHQNAEPTLFITGNHDNWTRGYFKSMGFDVEKNYRIKNYGNSTVFLHHGDGLDNSELGLPRPLSHRVLRNKWFVKLYQTLFPPNVGLGIMKRVSRTHRANPVISPEKLNKWSRKFLKNRDVDLILSGHDHLPRLIRFDFGSYINLGNFYQHRTIVEYTNGTFRLVVWNGDQQTCTPFEDHSIIKL